MPAESEDADAFGHVTERLLEAFPALEPRVVRRAVSTAYSELRYARVRTYLPVLMERRARDLLSAEEMA